MPYDFCHLSVGTSMPLIKLLKCLSGLSDAVLYFTKYQACAVVYDAGASRALWRQ